ncbi:MAG: transcriptional repressor [Deltaproteobacteria bacterium]|nr:transcriptional repressor [Deltaproteobacteria bacterium]
MQRNTKQREAIAACFSAENRPLTAAEVHAFTAKDRPSLGIATVYRTVNAFVEIGMLVPVLIGGTNRYELSAKPRHHHFYCQKCDRAYCLKECTVSKDRLAPEGFTVHDHELVVYGVCPSCRSTSNGKEGE